MINEVTKKLCNLSVGDVVRHIPSGVYGEVKKVDGLSVEVMLKTRVYLQTHRTLVDKKGMQMAKKTNSKPSNETKITINIIGDSYMKKVAVVSQKGESCVLRTFDVVGDPDWNTIIKDMVNQAEALETTPLPTIVTTTADEYKPKPEPYAGYKNWQPHDYEWGFDADSYTPPPKSQWMPYVKPEQKLEPIVLVQPSDVATKQKALF